MAQFELITVFLSLFLHGFLKLISLLPFSPKFGGIHETLNAVLAFNAFYHPFNALLLLFQIRLEALFGIEKMMSTMLLLPQILLWIPSYILITACMFHSLAVLHGTSLLQMVAVNIAAMIIAVMIIAIFSLIYISSTQSDECP